MTLADILVWEKAGHQALELFGVKETTVVVELNGLTDTEFLKKDKVQCKVLGIDTENPLLQLGTNIFSGEYKDSVGTHLLLNKKSEQDEVEYHSKTTKTLVMHRTFLNEKTGNGESSNVNDNSSKETNRPSSCSFMLENT